MIEKTLVLSTAHISKETNDVLMEARETALAFRKVNHECGFILWVSEAALEEEGAFRLFPELEPIMQLAIEKDCTLVYIDRDADQIGLQTFNW